MAYIKTAPIRCNTPKIFSALKYLSAIRPMIKGAIMAPNDWVEKAAASCAPVASRLCPKNVPKVTYHAPQTKNSKNIIRDNLNLILEFMKLRLGRVLSIHGQTNQLLIYFNSFFP